MNARQRIIIVLIVVVLAMFVYFAFTTYAHAAPLPPDKTEKAAPPPAGPYYIRLWCRNTTHVQAVRNRACRELGGYR